MSQSNEWVYIPKTGITCKKDQVRTEELEGVYYVFDHEPDEEDLRGAYDDWLGAYAS